MSTGTELPPPAALWRARANWSRPETWLGLVVALFALSTAWGFGDSWPGIDFYQFWLVGRALREGRVENVYTPEARVRLGEEGYQEALREAGPNAAQRPTPYLQLAQFRRTLETYSTPLLYGVFGSIAGGDYLADKNRWQHLSVLLHVLALLLAAAAFRLSLPVTLIALGMCTIGFGPFAADIVNGNVNALLLCAFAGTLLALARGWNLLAGALLGLSLAFKPTLALAPLPLLCALACARAWRPLARHALGLAAGGGAGIVLGALLGGGFGAWLRWLGELPALMREGLTCEDNFALARWISDHLGFAPGPWIVLLLLAPCALVAWRSRASVPDGSARASWLAAGALFALLTPGLVWIHYYEVAIPAVLCLFASTAPLMLACAALGAGALSTDMPSRLLGLAGTRQQANVVVLGALLLFAALLARLSARSAPARSA